MHAVVAGSTFPSQNDKRHQLLDFEMSKKCTQLWHEAQNFQVKSAKKDRYGPRLDVQMSFRAACARDCAPCQK